MLNHDHVSDVRNSFVGNGNDASLVVVGRAHRTSPGTVTTGKRLTTAYLATPAVDCPRAEITTASGPCSQEQWRRRQRQGMSGGMSPSGQEPAAIWASLVLAQQSAL